LWVAGSWLSWRSLHIGKQPWSYTYIQSRLDRFLATNEWIQNYPNFNNKHLLKFKYDHCPILLEFSSFFPCRNNYRHSKRKFEQIWLTDDQHTEIVQNSWHYSTRTTKDRLQTTFHALYEWGSQKFGHILSKVKEAQTALQILNSQSNKPSILNNIKAKEKELDMLLEQEELWWS